MPDGKENKMDRVKENARIHKQCIEELKAVTDKYLNVSMSRLEVYGAIEVLKSYLSWEGQDRVNQKIAGLN